MAEETAATGDDFKQISGIGPATERRLHEAGVLTYAQLAALSAEDIAQQLQDMRGMSPARVAQQDWIAQARELMPVEQPVAQKSEDAPGNGQRYATFTIELLLDKSSAVRRTRSVYIQGREERAWAGWDRQRLIAFIERQAELRSGEVKQKAAPEPAKAETPAVATRRGPAPAPASMRSSLDVAQRNTLREHELDLSRMTGASAESRRWAARTRRQPATAGAQESAGSLQVFPEGEAQPRRVLPHGQPFHVRLRLDRHERPGANRPAPYTVSLFAQRTESGGAEPVGRGQGTLAPGESDIKLDGSITAPGTYRLQAEISFAGAISNVNLVRGQMIQVY